MSVVLYKKYEDKYNKTMPIRGRAEECRPIGDRRKDNETLTLKHVDGHAVYSARLYDTDVIQFWPNGDVTLDIDAYTTASSVKFINKFSRFYACIRFGRMWVAVNESWLPLIGAMHIKYDESKNSYDAVDKQITRKMVDRAKSKEARDSVKDFAKWGESFLKMSDGWLMHETVKQVLDKEYDNQGRLLHMRILGHSAMEIYNMMTTSEEQYLKALALLMNPHGVPHIDAKFAEETMAGRKFYDMKYSVQLFKDQLKALVHQCADVHSFYTHEAKPGHLPVKYTVSKRNGYAVGR